MEKTLEFSVDRTVVRGKLFVPVGDGPFPGVVFFHGSGGIGETHFSNAKKLSERGFLTLAINYRGVGISEGVFEDQTISMGVEDARGALTAFLVEESLDPKRLGLSGGSYGGFVAATLCNKFPVKSIVLEAPASYSPEISLKAQRDVEDEIKRDNFLSSESYNEIEKYTGNLLIFKCELDDVLPEGMVEEYDKRAVHTLSKEIVVLKGAQHRISINPDALGIYQNKLIEFFEKTL